MTDLPAGPELDARVAEKVMGLPPDQWRHDAPGCEDTYYNQCTKCGATQDSKFSEFYDQEVCPEPAPYSTDIAAAWLVVEKLGVDGFMLHKSPVGSYWRAKFHAAELVMEQPYVLADTAPHAIALAALKAVGRG